MGSVVISSEKMKSNGPHHRHRPPTVSQLHPSKRRVPPRRCLEPVVSHVKVTQEPGLQAVIEGLEAKLMKGDVMACARDRKAVWQLIN